MHHPPPREKKRAGKNLNFHLSPHKMVHFSFIFCIPFFVSVFSIGARESCLWEQRREGVKLNEACHLCNKRASVSSSPGRVELQQLLKELGDVRALLGRRFDVLALPHLLRNGKTGNGGGAGERERERLLGWEHRWGKKAGGLINLPGEPLPSSG